MKTDPPVRVDLSQHAVARAVRAITAQHPITVFPVAVGGPLIVGAILLKLPFVVLAAGIIALGIAAAGFVVNQFFRHEIFKAQYVHDLHENLRQRKQASLAELQRELMRFGCPEAAQQIEALEEKFENLSAILQEKFNDGELTQIRYLGMAEQVYLAALDNLRDIITMLQSIETIDAENLSERMRELETRADDASRQALVALSERLALREHEIERVRDILAKNEHALTKLDYTAAEIAAVQITQGEAKMDLESAMLELQQLAFRARDYAA